MINIAKGVLIFCLAINSLVMAGQIDEDQVKREMLVKKFTSNLKDVTPKIGSFSFVACQKNFALSSIDIGVTAKLKNSIEIPFKTPEGGDQKVLIGSKDVGINFAIFSDEKVAPILSLDEVDLENMNFNCAEQERIVYKAQLAFESGDKDYADVSYTHPTVGSVRLRLEKFDGKAIKKGDDMYAAVKGVAQIETYDKLSNKVVFQNLDMLFRFHYNNSGDEPVFNMDAAQIADEIKEKLSVPSEDTEDVPVVSHERARVKVIGKNLSLRTGPSRNYDYVADAANLIDDDTFEVIARSGVWLNVEVDGQSLWMYGGKNFVQFLN